MIFRLIVYLVVLAITFFNYILYDDTIIKQLLGLELLYLFFYVIYFILMRKKITAKLRPVSEVAEKNSKITIRVEVTNKSKLFSTNVFVYVNIESISTGKKKRIKMQVPVGKKSTKTVKRQVSISKVGNYKISLIKIEYMDPVNIFCITKRYKEYFDIVVMPMMKLLMTEVSFRTKMFAGDSEEYSDRESGDDPSEIYQIRDYTENDSIHDIHWKLSAKTDGLLVKDRAKPEGCPVVIWLDYSNSKSDNVDDVFDFIASLSLSIRERNLNHMIVWYNSDYKKIEKKKVTKDENIYEAVRRFMYIKPYKDLSAVNILKDDFLKKLEYSTLINVDFDFKVSVNDVDVTISNKGKQILWEKVFIEL
ncbi:MAG: DUF58 domain-containing protein [Lachnospiraceae bacterium]|nr:DUF58 domain-containing protein [Lachnospiraceae bacterium]